METQLDCSITLYKREVTKENFIDLLVKHTTGFMRGIKIDDTYVVAKYISSMRYDESTNCLLVYTSNNKLYVTHTNFIIFSFGNEIQEHGRTYY